MSLGPRIMKDLRLKSKVYLLKNSLTCNKWITKMPCTRNGQETIFSKPSIHAFSIFKV